ncbi:MAG: sugar phosphate isomerase/epimerase [Verrucomicrobiae bacterium]|nr:sugar phosphate isomerase/epimerase [Verrucomicrobiae bacterium]
MTPSTANAHAPRSPLSRRGFLSAAGATLTLPGLAVATVAAGAQTDSAASTKSDRVVTPPEGRRLLLSCKLGMISAGSGDRKRTLAERLSLAGEAGFDGVDLDEAGNYTPEQARDAVRESGVFVHNAINHAHWQQRLTSPNAAERDQGRANIEHCIRVSHAAGGSGVLIVVGNGSDGTPAETAQRAGDEIRRLLPLAAAYGQAILVENVWNRMFYNHDGSPEQGPEQFIQFVDSFRSPWVGMYYDIGNHWKYGQPSEWIRGFGPRCVKLDVKGFSRAKNEFVDITSPDDDLPWDQVRKALGDIGFSGWATAEVGGGELARLKTVREQMQRAFGL